MGFVIKFLTLPLKTSLHLSASSFKFFSDPQMDWSFESVQ